MAEKKEYQNIRRLVVPMILLAVFFYLGLKYLGSEDFSQVLTWWMTLLFLGIVFQPLTMILFSRFHDCGWMFSKTLGIVISGWLTWFLSSCHILRFDKRSSSILMVLVCLLFNMILYYFYVKKRNRKFHFADYYTPDKMVSIFSAEVMFFILFICWCYIKGINPDAYGTERFMDYGYMMSISKTKYMPAADIWLSGNGINYYYVGQYFATFVTKLAGIPVAYGYNLAMMMLAAMGFCLPYSIGVNLMRIRIQDKKEQKLSAEEQNRYGALGGVTNEKAVPYWRPVCAGLISGLAVSIAGNMHYPIYKYIYPRLQYLKGEEEIYKYWFPDATRYIGYQPDTHDKTIHEFPIYSYVVGDLHAHVINTIFVFTILAVLFAWLLTRKSAMDAIRRGEAGTEPSLVKEIFHPAILVSAFLVGIFHMTNYWDFPIYFVVSGAIILFSNLVVYEFKKKAWLLTACQAALFVLVGLLVSLPFTLNFDSISTAILPCVNHTPLFQLAVLWGLPLTCVFVFFFILIFEEKDRRKTNTVMVTVMKNGKEEKKEAGFLHRFLNGLTVSDLFVLTIGLCAAGLILMPELIYVKDIYSGDYKRANTMFKLTYQAFIMFGIAMGYIIIKYISMPKRRAQKTFAIVMLILFSTTIGYFNEALSAWFTGYYKTLDATRFIADDCNKADAEMIEYINENIPEQSNILEMCGLSYTYFNRISVFTGMPTVLGWQTHEWLWRSSGTLSYPQIVTDRHDDIIKMYTSTDEAEVRALLEKYAVDYIYIGECELVDGYSQNNGDEQRTVEGASYEKINVNVSLLLRMGEVVKEIPPTETEDYTTYLIKVNR